MKASNDIERARKDAFKRVDDAKEARFNEVKQAIGTNADAIEILDDGELRGREGYPDSTWGILKRLLIQQGVDVHAQWMPIPRFGWQCVDWDKVGRMFE